MNAEPWTSRPSPDLARRMADALRMLAVDAVERANSGHPGAPMGMADMAQVLWHRHLQHNPANPQWPDRDRFVLSNGHASMLLYALLHLSGYDLPMEELKSFRRLHSKTPGHPEVRITPAWRPPPARWARAWPTPSAWRWPRNCWRRNSIASTSGRRHDIVDHFTYVFLGDGCLMEGISHEACSLAGTLRLSKLIALYDDNGISIDGQVQGWFTDDTPKRFEAYGWNVIAESMDMIRRRSRRRSARARALAARRRSRPDPDLLQDRHRSADRPTSAAAMTCTARRWAPRKWRRRDGLGLDERAVRDPAGSGRRMGRTRTRRGCRAPVARAVRSLPHPVSGPRPPSSSAAPAAACPTATANSCRRCWRRRRNGPTPLQHARPANWHWTRSGRCCRNCSAARPT